ncbi:FHA domain-containing protein [Humisphaera borealis]|uniref:FHA domain-containing protein n=1 Tax=Humisphaera borealis TaxID=2807512 RepID=A0A7M2X3F8_9BACT|nr:FHA domain-containing protein [Humisphaera borealis]QOV92159.1 FHA domain-containing protein [Humisphaera borealis]
MAGTTAPGITAPPTSGSQTLRVIHLTGSNAGTTQELAPGQVQVGRHPESRVRFDHTVDFLVSTRHGQFSFEQGQWYIIDTNSTNGTWVSGARVQRQALTQGMLVVLGTPGAAGSASFKVDLDGTATTGIPDGEGAFAQEPPSSSEMVRFVCQSCGAIDTAPAVDIGQNVDCGVCGKKTKVVPMSPTQGSQRSAGAPPVASGPPPVIPGSAAPGSQHPKAIIPEDAGFFGGIIGNVKGAIHRMKEKKELNRDIAAIEQQIPAIESALQQAATSLGAELWQSAGAATAASHEKIKPFRATDKLAALDASVEQVKERRKAAEEEASKHAADHQHWLEEWQARHATLEGDLALAVQTLADARAEQARARQAVAATASERSPAMAAISARLTELSTEAAGEPKDDFASRYQSAMEELETSLVTLKAPLADWADKVAARTAAAEALDRSTQAHAEATAKVAASNQEKSAKEAARAGQERAHQQALQSLSAEVDRIRQQAPALHADLGRQFVELQQAPAIDPPPGSLAAAKAALDRLKQAQATIAEKKKRLTELEAG